MKSSHYSAPLVVTALIGSILSSSQTAHAADYVWAGTKTGKSSDWFSAKNWKKVRSTNLRVGVSGLLSAGTSVSTLESATTVPGAGDTATITNGATVVIEQPITLAALTVEENSTVRGSGDITVTSSLTLQDARLAGEGDISIPKDAIATLSSEEAGSTTGNTINKEIENAGVINWTSGDLTLQKDLHNTGEFNVQSDDAMKASGMVTPTLVNEGTLVTTPTAGEANIEIPFKNSGDIYLRGGNLEVGPQYVQSDGSLNLDGGNLTSTGTLQITGGEVKGTGILGCNVVQTGGRFKPGHSPGTITISGNYTQASTAFLDMEIGGYVPGTAHDQMIIWGTADLNGTLDLIKYNSFLPEDGCNIELLRYMNVDTAFKTVTGRFPGGSVYYIVAKTSTSFFACGVEDITDPTLQITSPVHNSTYQGVASVKGTCVDPGSYPYTPSGIRSLTVRLYRYANGSTPAGYWLGGTSWSTTASSSNERVPSGVANWTLTLPSLPPNKYLVRALAYDNVGNGVLTANTVFTISSTSGTFVKAPEPRRSTGALIAYDPTPKFTVSSRS